VRESVADKSQAEAAEQNLENTKARIADELEKDY